MPLGFVPQQPHPVIPTHRPVIPPVVPEDRPTSEPQGFIPVIPRRMGPPPAIPQDGYHPGPAQQTPYQQATPGGEPPYVPSDIPSSDHAGRSSSGTPLPVPAH